MISAEKRLKELSERLNSSKQGTVIETIGSLRNKAPFSGAVTLLAELYDKTENQAIKDNIRDFMNDLKESSARAEIAGAIKKLYKHSTIAMLVSSCWQSGLDYSPYAPDFAVVFNKGDYVTALECFTVIEESSQHLPKDIRDKIIMILRENEEVNPMDKSALMMELVAILR